MQAHRVRLGVELLEDRCVLSTTRLLGSNLFINADKTGGNLTLTAVADNTFQLSGTATGRFVVAGNIFLIGSDANDVVTVNLNGFTYAGNLFVFNHNGNDAVTVGGGTIRGNVYLLAGTGNDGLTLSGRVGGTVTVHAQSGRDTFVYGNGSSIIGGDLTVTGVSAITLGTGADSVGGTVTVNSTLVNTGVSFTSGAGLTVGNNFFLTTGAGADTATFGRGNINGLVSINLGEGANVVNNTGALTVAGDFDLFTGSGANSVTLNPGTVIDGNAQLNLGDGNNNLTGLNNAFTVQGNLQLFAGNGNNTAFTFGGAVAGNATVRFGNGTDNLTFAGSVAGMLDYTSGNGDDTLTLAFGAAAPLYQVNARFGNGDDIFATTGTGTLFGNIDGGHHLFGNSFRPSDGTLIQTPFSLMNFP